MTAPRLLLATALLAAAELPGAVAIDHLRPGEPVPEERLPLFGGAGEAPLVEPGKVSVFVFFRPGQDHSEDALARLAALEREFSGKLVSFVAVASGSTPPAELSRARAEAGVRMPVLLDPGDRVYGRLEVRLHPLVGVADARGRLVAWEPFRKVNYGEVLRARIRQALGEISEAEAQRAVDPPRSTMPGDDPRLVARRDVTLGRMLLERGNASKALESARRALSRDPGSAAAHALAAEAQASLGDCAAAEEEYRLALAADPAEPGAAPGKRAPCPPAPRP